MRLVRLIAVVAWAGVALLAVAGFAAFSPDTTDTAAVEAASSIRVTGVSDVRGEAAGLVAAQAFSGQQIGSAGPGAPEFSETAALQAYAGIEPNLSIPPITTSTLPSTTSTTVRPTTTTTTTIVIPNGSGVALGSAGPCKASYYGEAFAGRTTANGEIFDPSAMTAATHFVDFNTIITVTRVDTGASVQVRVNDRGPYMPDLKTRHTTRCIDLSKAAMQTLGGLGAGVVRVTLTMPADTNGLARLQAKYGAF